VFSNDRTPPIKENIPKGWSIVDNKSVSIGLCCLENVMERVVLHCTSYLNLLMFNSLLSLCLGLFVMFLFFLSRWVLVCVKVNGSSP